MRTLVTGATGFLGRHLVRALESRGHEAVPFSRSTGGDVLDLEALKRAVVGCEAVLHCAGLVSHDARDAEALYRVHVEGTKNVLLACRATGTPRVVLASSSGTVAVSESPDRIAVEGDPPPVGILGRWPYYRAKLFAERAALEQNSDETHVVSVNPSLLLGPGDVNGSSTEDVRLFLDGRIAAVPGGGLSFVDARDAADAMCLALERGRAGERYLVGAINLSVRDFFARLARIAGQDAPWLPVPRSRELARFGAKLLGLDETRAEMGSFFWYLDATKAQRDLGWRPRDPNATLHETVEDLRQRGVVWPNDARRDAKRTTASGLSSQARRRVE
jgi:dihydroflavonol-4-reductase